MYFRVLADHGDVISGYVVPDNSEGHCDIVVRCGGRELGRMAANESQSGLAGLIDIGRHQSGACGFTIDERFVSGLRELLDLEIYEADSQVLIYRRRRARHVEKRILRLESHLYPLWRLDAALNLHFQYTANRIDNLGHETITQMLLPYDVASVYVTGRLLHDRYRSYIEQNFEVMFMMHHPLEEFAERLVFLSRIKTKDSDVLSARDSLSLRSAIDFAKSLTFHDEAALGLQLRDIPDDVARAFVSPVTRQLTTSSPDEMPRKQAVARALDILGSFALVGLRRAPRAALAALGEVVGIDARELPPMTNLPGVTVLAKVLKRTHAAVGLLDHDLELYQHVADAYRGAGLAKSRVG